MVDYEADQLAAAHLGDKAKTVVWDRTWSTRFGLLRQNSMFLGSEEALWTGLDALMEFVTSVLVDERCERLAATHLSSMRSASIMTFMDELEGGNGPLRQLLNMAENDLPADFVIPRLQRAAGADLPAIAAALRRCYASAHVSISVVVDPSLVDTVYAKLERHGALVIEVEQFVGRMP